MRHQACQRVKGVLRVGSEYVAVNAGHHDTVVLSNIAYRDESRLEVILHKVDISQHPATELDDIMHACLSGDWGGLEADLKTCLNLK